MCSRNVSGKYESKDETMKHELLALILLEQYKDLSIDQDMFDEEYYEKAVKQLKELQKHIEELKAPKSCDGCKNEHATG